MSAKQIIATLILLAGATGLSLGAFLYPKARRVYLCLFFLGTLQIFHINFVSREDYRGWVRGFEITNEDVVLVGLFAAVLAGASRHRIRLLPPLFLPYLLYVLIAALSATQAFVPLYAGFGMLKLLRNLVALWVLANAVRDEEDLRWLVWASALCVGYESFISLKAYFQGVYRARGTFPHSNTLGMFLNLHLPILFAYLFNAPTRWKGTLLAVFGIGAGVVILTLSRGSWVCMGLALALVILLSLGLRLRPEKLFLLAGMFVLSLPPGVIAVQKMMRRIAEAPEASGEARHTFNDVAKEMAHDRFFGVGINNYSYGTDEPYSAPFAGGLDQGGLCHNFYFITVGELGWLGLVALLLLLADVYLRILVYCVRNFREGLPTIYMVGCLGGILTVTIQNWLEWALHQTSLSMTFYGLLGVASAITRLPRPRPGDSFHAS